MVTRGLEEQSRRSSGRGTFFGDDGQALNLRGSNLFAQTASYGSSGAEEAFYDETAAYMADGVQPYPPL